MSHNNISIFIPHAGCPHMCSFCNQKTISGAKEVPHAEDVDRICSEVLSAVKDIQNTEIAFFGGSFTAIDREYMIELLSAADKYIKNYGFKGIRISTRPDYIDDEVLQILKQYGVTAIELGAQSLDNEVLNLNERGHTAEDVYKASALIKQYGFELGLQMMIGLYGSTKTTEYETVKKIIEIAPDTVRIYPVVILKNTKLAEMLKIGKFRPFEFEDVIEMTEEFIDKFEKAGIRIIKVGLHASELVEEEMVGGFYHPAFREICESLKYRKEIEKLFKDKDIDTLTVSVPQRNLSKAIGQKKSNINYFSQRGKIVKIIADKEQKEFIKVKEIK